MELGEDSVKMPMTVRFNWLPGSDCNFTISILIHPYLLFSGARASQKLEDENFDRHGCNSGLIG